MGELTKLGRYKLGKVLGRGAMGVVYEGLDPSLNRRVAIKTILKNAAIDAETAAMYSAQFAREAQAAGRLNHPNIVQVHDFAEEGEIAYLVMEYIQGRELRSFFEAKERFEPAEAVRIMGELLDALDLAHEAGVIHRDIKPANVMLDAQRRVKLADFGVARIQDSERSAAGTMVGTPAFMSPEQISGGKIDRRTDLFSAGVVLYQLLTGEQPFKGEGAWTVAKKIMQDDPPLPSVVVPSVSPIFDGIVNKALAKIPAERFASAKEFAVALRGVLAAGAQATYPPAAAPRPKGVAAPKASEAEVEFWRAIQNSTDAAEFEFYLEQFPDGTYAQLARHKIAKLSEPAGAARRESEDTVRLQAEALARREAEERAAREAEEKSKREAEEKARREAEEKARREAEQRAKQAAEKAKRDAEERARLEAEAKARRDAVEAEAKVRREAAEKARREAEMRSAREAEEKARQAQALARLKQQEAAARAKAAADEDATVAIGGARSAATPPAPPPAQKKSFAIPAIAAIAVIVAGIAAYLLLGRTPTPAPVAEAPPVPKAAPPAPAAAPAVDVEKIRRETEERVRKEFADKAAVERAAMEKSVAEKLAAEKASADKLAQAKTAAEKAEAEKAVQKAAAERAAAEKAASEKAASAKAAADKAAAERAAAEKAASEKAAIEKAAAEKLAAEKAAAAKAAASARKPWLPAVGDRWVYESKDSDHPERRGQLTVVAKSVTGNSVTEEVTRPNGQTFEATHRPFPVLVGTNAPGVANFSPYLPAFQELRPGLRWDNIEFLRLFRCDESSFTCKVSGRVAGREKVSVQAGTFDATKVVLELVSRGSNGGGGTAHTVVVELSYWYAEAANRYVKYQLRSDSSLFSQPRMDMELLSYTPAGR
jgi:serine/threonine-protein kinase